MINKLRRFNKKLKNKYGMGLIRLTIIFGVPIALVLWAFISLNFGLDLLKDVKPY